MVWLHFLEELVKKCGELGLFEIDTHTLSERVITVRVNHGKVESNSSREWLLPTDPALKLVGTSSVEATVGSVLTHVTTTINNTHPNILDISFVVRRSSRRALFPPSFFLTHNQIVCYQSLMMSLF